jgi:hypothetical protein
MPENKFYTTTEVANLLRVQGNTVRRGLCVNGHYLGLNPVKGPNGRLLWPVGPVDNLLSDNCQETHAQTAG